MIVLYVKMAKQKINKKKGLPFRMFQKTRFQFLFQQYVRIRSWMNIPQKNKKWGWMNILLLLKATEKTDKVLTFCLFSLKICSPKRV